MKRCILTTLAAFVFVVSSLVSSDALAATSKVKKPTENYKRKPIGQRGRLAASVANAEPDYYAYANTNKSVHLKSSLPWECIKDNVKTWKFMLINMDPVTYDSCKLKQISDVIEDYVATYFYPTYRVKVSISTITPPTDAELVGNGLSTNATRTLDIPELTDYIPVYLVDEFSPDVPNGFGTAFHGQVNDSVMNGIHPYFYLNPHNSLFRRTSILAAGMPFIIIPRGSIGPNGTNNGIMAEIVHNIAAGYGPTDFDDALAYTLAYEMLEVLENPSGLIYILSGNTLEQFGAGNNPTETCYLKSLCAPFSIGSENIRQFEGHSMPNFALPSYFFPYVDQLSQGNAVYDSMGNGSAPLTPYKGTQFVMYQEAPNGVLSDLQSGSYTSTDSDPYNLVFTSYGSIYTWSGWGYELAQNNLDTAAFNASVPNCEAFNSGIATGRRNLNKLANFDCLHAPKASSKSKLKPTVNGLFPGRKHTPATIKDVTSSSGAVKIAGKKTRYPIPFRLIPKSRSYCPSSTSMKRGG